jgi:replicative superfamily II helicase
MLDFKKKLASSKSVRKIDPTEIYDSLDRSSETGPLRPVQARILNDWYKRRQTKKDVVLKLHTGQGKTLIGLLILQSVLNQDKGPALYICPNKQLAIQTASQAKKFGLPYILLDEEATLPIEFTEGKKILITHVQKVFHGLTKFGLNRGSVSVGGIVLDDSHACIDSIKNSFTIRITKEDSPYIDFIELFEEGLKSQGIGTYQEIRQNEHSSILPVPYWGWMDKIDRVLEIISKYRTENYIKFQWPLIKNTLKNCQCIVSGAQIEITPYLIPIDQFGFFSNADHRILMSATTLDDSFFVKGLGISAEAINKPLTDSIEKWSGEKIVLIPSLIDESLDRITIINEFGKPNSRRKFGEVFIVPSFKRSELYKKQGCIVSNNKTIVNDVELLKSGSYATPIVIVNRYDGIDLPDDACRILVLDSMPYVENLSDQYEEQCRPQSDLINVSLAQKIEQGLGRSVRGEKDFCVIILLGSDLVNFVQGKTTNKYLSDQTVRQIEIGLDLVKLTKEAISRGTEPIVAFNGAIKQCLVQRDDDWKEFYTTEMDQPFKQVKRPSLLQSLQAEFEAEKLNSSGEHKKARSILQTLSDATPLGTEKGWHLQQIARFEYWHSKVESNKLQVSAYKKNPSLLKPLKGVEYEKIGLITGSRIARLKNVISEYDTFEKLMISTDGILDALIFGEESGKFETALRELGILLGFESQRPEKEDKQGPDNLWCVGRQDFILFECKNEVKSTRTEINKLETGQMNNSCGWFEVNYPGTSLTPIMIIPTKNVTAAGAFNYPVKIMRKGKLNNLKANVRSFIKEFSSYDLSGLDDTNIQNFLNAHNLDTPSIKSTYSESPYQQR